MTNYFKLGQHCDWHDNNWIILGIYHITNMFYNLYKIYHMKKNINKRNSIKNSLTSLILH